MDVTFTNVLEGARQYFQGLPTATQSQPNPGPTPYTHPNETTNQTEQNQQAQQQSTSAYWPPQEANRPPTRTIHQSEQRHYQYPEQTTNQFQFSRPHSREAPSNQYQQQYETPPTSQYHQLQNVGYYQQQQQQQQQQKTTQYYNNMYKMGTNQQPTNENAYYKHLYNTSTNQIQYQQQQQKGVEPKDVPTNPNQVYRTTHNLPPIATLSLISYQNRTNRDVPRTTIPKTKTLPTYTLNQIQKSASQTYQDGSTDYRYNQNRLPQTFYSNTNNTTQNYTQVTTSNTINYSQSSTQYYQPNKNQINGRIQPIIKQKRESPLDLSVKTVRTPADSTLDDEDRKYYRTANQNYEVYYQRNLNRNVQQSAAVPKVEFHPNFNSLNYRTPRSFTTTTNRYPTVSIPTVAHVNSYIQPQKRENLPRIEFSPQKTLNLYQEQKKRPAESTPSIIPNKITKVDTWKQKFDQEIEQRFNEAKNKAILNGSYQERPYQRQYQYQQYHNQTYVPSASAHQYPNYQYQYLPRQQNQQKNNIGGADKRVLSLLRSSLEIKEQKKLEQEQIHKSRLDIQQPSTDVTAPIQPKPTIINRNNVSPFTPTNLPENNNMYKLHIPKAIDSINVNFDSDSQVLITNQNSDLDGLAALVAARIRTKAELKQVGGDKEVTPPKLMKEKPRRRLFSRNEEDITNVPLRDKTGLRSSSETSVFDFPDTDSESEMPVLERQTLEDMRRNNRKLIETKRPESPDEIFAATCQSFMEQLKTGSGKKRGRRKKIEAEVLAKLESVTKEKPIEIKKEDDEDSDVPLNQIKTEKLSVSLSDISKIQLARPAKKPVFGDGSHFYPGWEEEVYKYKKSLRIPPSLIHVTRPPQFHRLSTSLPDLDPRSPKIKQEQLDTDEESNQSFNIFSRSNYDSEGSCTSLPNTTKENNSILDRLLERYGGRKKKKFKKKETKLKPKIEKLELLPTPGYETPNQFNKTSPEVFPKNSRILKQKTIKEVFGEDRPASAPPVTCLDHYKIKDEPDDDITLSNLIKKQKNHDFQDTRQVLKNKLLNRGRKENLLKSLVDKKIKSELLDDDDSKSETPSIDGDESNLSGKKRNKFRNIRRKFSSGFDYIRKKKKKKEEGEVTKVRKGGKFTSKSNPGSVQDIQKEIKGWVLNKGIGETILHRAARLGYTDITAYCLEKMECSPSPKDNAGYTPLHEASTKGNLAIAKMLLMYGANVHESARGGIRPLHEAVENGYVEIVRLLLSYGADPMLATYSGMTPLALSTDEATTELLQNHINDIEGKPGSPWCFGGPASCFDTKETGFDTLSEAPPPDPPSDTEDLDFEISDTILPNLYTLRGEPPTDRWLLLQDLSTILKIKSRDTLLRQICPNTANHKTVLRELKMSDFLEQAHCCQFLNIGEKVNTRASKIALVKYTEKVREVLNVEKVTISVR